MSLGVCPKLHDNNLLTKYKNSSSFMKSGYEKLLKKFLSGFVRDVQRKIETNKNRLENGFLSGTEIAIQKRISLKEEEINETVLQLEKLGNEGRIEECQLMHNQLEEKQKELKYDKIELENHKKSSREKQEDVCHICGAYISKNDPRNSIENHISGRIHCGYVRINEILEDLEKIFDDDPTSAANCSDDGGGGGGGGGGGEGRNHKRRDDKDSDYQHEHRSRDRSRQRSREKRHRRNDDRRSRSSKNDQRPRTTGSKSRDRTPSREKWNARALRNGGGP